MSSVGPGCRVGARALALAAAGWLAALGCAARETGAPVWFDDLPEVPAPDPAAMEAVTAWVSSEILEGGETADLGLVDPWPRIVFLTTGDGEGPAEVHLGTGRGLVEAAARATAQAMSSSRSMRPVGALKIDFVVRVSDERKAKDGAVLAFERGLDGLAFERGSEIAFLPDEVLTRTLVNSDLELRLSNVERYLRGGARPRVASEAALRSRGEVRLQTFRTQAYYADRKGTERLYRGHREARRHTRVELMDAAAAAGSYLRAAVAPDGRFVYSYLPKTDEEKDAYNILRHAGTAYSMLELYEATGDRELLGAARRALAYLRGRIGDCFPADPGVACVEEGGFVKLGGNALAALALTKHAAVTGDRSDLGLVRRLGRWIVAGQSAAGEFEIHKQELATGRLEDFESEYYPGEAVFALARLAELDRDPAWSEAAAKGARYLLEVRDGAVPDGEQIHDHWLLYALAELQSQRPDRRWVEGAERIGMAIVEKQNLDPEFPDWRGSYYRPPRSTPTATRTEGLCAAYRVARGAGRLAAAARFLEAARMGVGFQLQMQFGPESALYLEDPARVLGGVRRSLTDYTIRIDYVQHTLSSVLALAGILDSGE